MDWKLETSWGVFPPAKNAYKANWFTTFYKIWQSLREKSWAIGGYVWPPNSVAGQFYWGSGLIGSVSNNNDGTFHLVDGTTPANNWSTAGLPGFTGTLYGGGSSLNLKFRPTSFDVIISFDDLDPRKQVRAQIITNTAGEFDMDGHPIVFSTLTIKSYQDYVTAKLIDGITPPSRAKYYIVERGSVSQGKGLWWADVTPGLSRTPDYPDGNQDDFGDVSQGENNFALINNFDPLFKPPMLYGTDTLIGKEFVVFGSDGFLHRIPITGNEVDGPTGKNKIKFAKQTFKVSGNFSIVPPGTVVWPGRQLCPPFIDYTGRKTDYFVHAPASPSPPVVHPVVATDIIYFSEGLDHAFCPDCDTAPGDCAHDAFTDSHGPIDVWSAIENVCGGPPSSSNRSYTPWFYKSLSGVQVTIEDLCVDFVPPLVYPVSGRNPKQNFTPALLFEFAKINNGKSVVLDKSGGDYHASVDSKYEGFSVYYTVLKPAGYEKDEGLDRQSGQATVTGGLINLGNALFNPIDNPDEISDVGDTVIYSAGWTRYYPKMFRFMYDAAGFIPDSDTSTDPPSVFYPPSIEDFGMFGCFGVGQWIKRPKSTSMMTFDARGRVAGGSAFIEGDLAVYMGESYNYPTETETTSDGDDGTIRYYDRMSEIVNLQRPYADTQEKIVNQTKGGITSFNAYSLTDQAKHWLKSWWGGGVGHTESGNATQAGDGFIQDTSKATGAANCWWKEDRFSGYDYPYEGFIIEIDHNPGDGLRTYKMPITFVDPTIVRIEFDSVGITFEVSDAYRIIEPDTILNRYAGKSVTVKTDEPDPEDPKKLRTFDLTIVQNDDNTLYFDKSEVLQESPLGLKIGWSFKINEFYPGGTYQWDGEQWVAPSGVDSRVDGRMFRPTPEENAADWVKSYGHCRKYDYPINSNRDGALAEIRRALDSLIWTRTGGTWTPDYVDGVPENNFRQGGYSANAGGSGGCIGSGADFSPYRSMGDALWSAAVPVRVDTVPQSFAGGDWNNDGSVHSDATASYAYCRSGTIPTIMKSSLLYFCISARKFAEDGFTPVYTDNINTDYHVDTEYFEQLFNAQGTAAQREKYTPFYESPPEQTPVRTSNKMGSTDTPPVWRDPPLYDCGTPEDPHFSGASVQDSYIAVDPFVIIRWDVSGGMKFVGPTTNP